MKIILKANSPLPIALPYPLSFLLPIPFLPTSPPSPLVCVMLMCDQGLVQEVILLCIHDCHNSHPEAVFHGVSLHPLALMISLSPLL